MILSGANLSDTYFTNRQDRYILFKRSPALADFFASLMNALTTAKGFCITTSSAGSSPSSRLLPPPPPPPPDAADIYALNSKLCALISERGTVSSLGYGAQTPDMHAPATVASSEPNKSEPPSTWVFPLVQFHAANVHQDEEVTKNIFGGYDFERKHSAAGSSQGERGGARGDSQSELTVTSGYMNFTDAYFDRLLHRPTVSDPTLSRSFWNSLNCT